MGSARKPVFTLKGYEMTQRRSKLIVGVGVLCFVGVMALWLASSGDRAIADADKAPLITQTLTQAMEQPAAYAGKAASKVVFEETEGLVQRLSVHVDIKSIDAKQVKVYLTSPSGTKVLLVDGAHSKAVKKGRLDGWFGADGLQTADSLAAFAGEPLGGAWTLGINSKVAGTLTKWSLSADVGPNNLMGGMEVNYIYQGTIEPDSCSCRVSDNGEIARGLLASGLLLLGIVCFRRRRS